MASLGEAFEAGRGTDLFRVHRYTNRAAGADALIKEMRDALDCRLDAMKAAGVRLHKPTPAEPMDILVIDELLLLGDTLKKGVHSPLGEIMSMGRKAGYSVLACTQLGEKAQLGSLRELMTRRICFRTGTREQTETVIGSGGKADMAPAHRINSRTPGVGYAYDESTSTAVKFRALYLSDAQASQVAIGEVPSGMEAFGKPAPSAGPHALYRLYDRNRELLYVGETNDPKRRFTEHAADKKWWRHVDVPSIDLQWFNGVDARADAKAAEAAAIEAELPRHNTRMNIDNPLRLVPSFADDLSA